VKRLFLFLIVFSSISLFAQRPVFSFPDNFTTTYYDYSEMQPGVDCLNNQFILKIKSNYSSFCTNNQINITEVNQILNFAKVTEVKKLYPNHTTPKNNTNEMGQKLTDLSLIYNITYAANIDVRKLIAELNALGAVEYAAPRIIEQPMLVPNDDSLGLQWYLAKIRAMQAWDLDTGDTNVIIAIVDGGTHFTHQDLAQNVAYNYADPIDGIDNDNDGFIDNFRGWDTGQGDNNPQFFGGPLNSAHGVAMCGLAAASTNNDRGVAGAGYKCRYLPVKMVNNPLGWIAGYEGLVYAADHQAKIINASWGGTFPSPYEQDVVNYVVINRGCLMFAAAGNSNNTNPFYPASYEGVLAVGGTQQNDTKSGNSSYYEQVDLVSPGQAMLEPYDVGYANGNGTSDASALTSGAAGIVQSYYSNYTPLQIGARMIQTAYRIDTIPGNAPYINKQGAGRLDVFASITYPIKPFIYFNERNFTDNNDDVIMIGDTVHLFGNMLNILDTTTTLMAIITDNSPYVNWLDSSISLGAINELNFVNTSAQPFQFIVLPGCPVNENILMKVVYFDGTDTLNTQYFSFVVNRDYYNVQVNKLHTTVTTTGRIGFSDNRTTKGIGYRMEGKENNLLGLYWNPMGLFVSKNNTSVSDQTLSNGPLGPCCNWANDADMQSLQNIIVDYNSIIADVEITSKYNDAGAGVNAVGVNVQQKLFGWNDSINDQFLLLQYQFQNNTGTALSNWNVGLFADFDMPDSLLWNIYYNVAFYDSVSQSAVVYNPAERYYVGYKLLAPGATVKYYANQSDGSGGHQNVYDGFSSAEKYNFMNPSVASNITLPTDVSHYLGLSFDTLFTDGCAMMNVALIIGNSLNDFRDQAAAAQAKFNSVFNIWTGNGGNNNWHNAANWSQNSVPDFFDHVIIPDTRTGSGFSPLISTADGMVKNIEIRCGGNLELATPYKLRVGN